MKECIFYRNDGECQINICKADDDNRNCLNNWNCYYKQLTAKEEETERLKAENEELKNKLKLATLFIKNNLETVNVINELKSLIYNPARLDGEINERH